MDCLRRPVFKTKI